MGGHIDRCDNPECNKLHISYNSCRNRHCPKCQGHLREQWIANREAELINTPYFHVVFTLPSDLNPQALAQPKLIYSLLFATAWGVIRDFGANPKMLGAKTGMIAILHTCLSAVQDFGRRRGRTFHCTLTCIALFRPEGLLFVEDGKPPVQKEGFCFRSKRWEKYSGPALSKSFARKQHYPSGFPASYSQSHGSSMRKGRFSVPGR